MSAQWENAHCAPSATQMCFVLWCVGVRVFVDCVCIVVCVPLQWHCKVQRLRGEQVDWVEFWWLKKVSVFFPSPRQIGAFLWLREVLHLVSSGWAINHFCVVRRWPGGESSLISICQQWPRESANQGFILLLRVQKCFDVLSIWLINWWSVCYVARRRTDRAN